MPSPSCFLLSPPAAAAVRGLVAERGGSTLEPRRIASAPGSGGGGSAECAPAVVESAGDGGVLGVRLFQAGMGSSPGTLVSLAVTERSPQATIPVGSVVLAHRIALVAGDDGANPPSGGGEG